MSPMRAAGGGAPEDSLKETKKVLSVHPSGGGRRRPVVPSTLTPLRFSVPFGWYQRPAAPGSWLCSVDRASVPSRSSGHSTVPEETRTTASSATAAETSHRVSSSGDARKRVSRDPRNRPEATKRREKSLASDRRARKAETERERERSECDAPPVRGKDDGDGSFAPFSLLGLLEICSRNGSSPPLPFPPPRGAKGFCTPRRLTAGAAEVSALVHGHRLAAARHDPGALFRR
jgi:hypothetical protein